MKRIRLIFLLVLFLTGSLIFKGEVMAEEIAISKEAAIELLKPVWEIESYPVDSPMVLYLLKMEELSWQIVQELEFKLAREAEPETGGWQLLADQQVIRSIWPGLLLELGNKEEKRLIKNEYDSWLITVPHKEGIISINNILINDRKRETPAYFRISLTPMDLSSSDERIYTDLKLEYKDESGTRASVETAVWLSRTGTEPVAFIKLYQEGKGEEHYRYFALFIEARRLFPGIDKETSSILVMNNIRGLNQLFSLDKSSEIENQFAFYMGSRGGIIELERARGMERVNLSLLDIDDTPGYQLRFDKGFTTSTELLASVLVQKKKEAYLMLGLIDSMNYSANLKCQVSFYPLVITLDDYEGQQPLTEVLFSYTKGVFTLSYQGSCWNEEISSTLKVNYVFTPGLGLSVAWKEEAWYLGLLYNR